MIKEISSDLEFLDKDSLNWKIFKAIVVGSVIRIFLNSYMKLPIYDYRIPLIDLMPARLWMELLTAAFLIITLAWVKFSSCRAYWLVFSIIYCFYIGLEYLRLGAFSSFHLVFSLLLVFVADNKTHNQKKIMSVLFLSSIFLSAAFFKLNKDFLSGFEFQKDKNFLIWMYQAFDLKNLISDTVLNFWLPRLAIASELTIGTLFLLNSRWAIHLCQIFILVLSIINPHVFYVYFCFLPVCLLIEPGYFDFLSKKVKTQFLTTPFFWVVVLFLVSGYKTGIVDYPYTEALIMIFLIGYHSFLLFRGEGRFSFYQEFNKFNRQWETFLIPSLVLISVILKMMGAPSPLGYSMFAGLKNINQVHRIEFYDQKICRILYISLNKSVVTDANLTYVGTGDSVSCIATYPTIDGMNVIRKKVCENSFNVDLSWKFKSKKDSTWLEQNCSNYL